MCGDIGFFAQRSEPVAMRQNERSQNPSYPRRGAPPFLIKLSPSWAVSPFASALPLGVAGMTIDVVGSVYIMFSLQPDVKKGTQPFSFTSIRENSHS
jgi:hypothetical protein